MEEEVEGRVEVHLSRVLQGQVGYMDLTMVISLLLTR
jgi:hypothetical protein